MKLLPALACVFIAQQDIDSYEPHEAVVDLLATYQDKILAVPKTNLMDFLIVYQKVNELTVVPSPTVANETVETIIDVFNGPVPQESKCRPLTAVHVAATYVEDATAADDGGFAATAGDSGFAATTSAGCTAATAATDAVTATDAAGVITPNTALAVRFNLPESPNANIIIESGEATLSLRAAAATTAAAVAASSTAIICGTPTQTPVHNP